MASTGRRPAGDGNGNKMKFNGSNLTNMQGRGHAGLAQVSPFAINSPTFPTDSTNNTNSHFQSNGIIDDASSTTSSSITSPPYWVHSHTRNISSQSVESMLPGGITLEDNTDGEDDKNRACWAKGVYIDDYVVVNGNRTGAVGAFVVWNITVETLNGGSMRIRKRYSEFDDLRERLLMTFPNSAGAMPPLPPKSVISKFRSKFLEQRRVGLSYFLNCILLNPEFSGSPVLKKFLFS